MAILNFFPGGGGSGKDISAAVVTLGASLQYTGAIQTQTVASVVLNGVTLNEGTDYVVIGNTGTNVGSFQLTVLGFGNYSGYVTAAWSISKALVTKPTVNVGTYTYNGSVQGPSITGFNSTTMNKTGDSETNAGNYTLVISLADTANSEWSDHTTASITEGWSIGKATPTVTAPTAKTGLTYNGSARALVNAGSTTGGELQYSTDGTNYSTSIPTGTNAGTYTVYYKVVGDTNYNDVAASSVSVTINKAQGTISVNPTSLSISGAAGATKTATITKTGDGAITPSSSASGVATATVSGTTVTARAVGTGSATITLTMAEGDNYLGASCTLGVTVEIVSVFGVMWDYNSTGTALTRLTPSSDPNGYVTETVTTEPSPAVGTGSGSSPFDNYAPWKDMDEYNIVNNAVSYRKGASGFSRSNYDTMVYIPTFYFKIVKDTSAKKMYFYVSNGAISGFTLHPGSNSYIGRYHTGNSSGYVSKTGLAAVASITRATARTNSHSKGAKWWQWGVFQWLAVQLLYLVEFADFNSQAKIGNGRAYSSGTGQNSGGTDSMTYHTGRASGTENQQPVQYRHIENIWGNYRNFVDGINFSDRKAYVCTDPSKWADDTATNYTDAGLTLPSDGYIKELGVSSSFPWLLLPTASGGSETTYVPDYVASNTGWRVAGVAGGYNTSLPGNYGMFYFNGNFASSGTSAVLGSRLLFLP